jgi:hypothetical protein
MSFHPRLSTSGVEFLNHLGGGEVDGARDEWQLLATTNGVGRFSGNKKPLLLGGVLEINPGGVLLSHTVTRAVPSAP